MIGLTNRDSSFFKVTSKDIKEKFGVLTHDIESFEFTEEQGKMNSGNIVLHDPDWIYASILRAGKLLDIEFGYNKNDIFSLINPDPKEMKGNFKRQNIRARIQLPSGSGTETGKKTYNCNFISSEFVRGVTNKVYRTGTKRDVVKTVLQRLGVDYNWQYVDFTRGSEKITPNTYVMQNESDFKFLFRMAFEWRAVFKLGYNSKGRMIGLFAQYGTVEFMAYSQVSAQAIAGTEVSLDYMYRTSRTSTLVKSFSFQQQGGASGDNVRVYLGPDGKPQFQFVKAQNETTQVYRFHPERVKAKLKSMPDFGSRADLVKDWLNTQNFDKLIKEGYFTLEVETTAPQGIGWTINCKTIGNPYFTAPMRVNFGKPDTLNPGKPSSLGFPDIFKNSSISFFVRKVVHNITPNGYECDLDIADAFTITGGSMI